MRPKRGRPEPDIRQAKASPLANDTNLTSLTNFSNFSNLTSFSSLSKTFQLR
jgi:hypothetical protein